MKFLALFTFLVAASCSRVVLEPRVKVGSSMSWSLSDRVASPDEPITFVVVMKRNQKQRETLEKIFWEVSDPDHPKYGQYLTQKQLAKLVAPKKSAYLKVMAWLKTAKGAEVHSGAMKDLIRVQMSVAEAERMFDTRFARFTHNRAHSIELLRVVKPYSVPSEIAKLISIIDPFVRFPALDESIIVSLEGEKDPVPDAWPTDCGTACGREGGVTPQVLSTRYQFPMDPVENAQGMMACSEYQGVSWSETQILLFNSTCTQNVVVSNQVGSNSASKCDGPLGSICIEALLDIEYIGSVAPGIPLTVISNRVYSLLNWAKELEDMKDGELPQIHSVSYGNDEAQQTSPQYMQECNVEFQKLATRGVSVLFASGDQGVWGREGKGLVYHPDFPAGSPYITAVGGTDFATKSVIGDEKAWNNGGGGFSNNFAAPDYQAAAVAAYKQQKGLPDQKFWNATGRGYPDVAALGGQQNPYCVTSGNHVLGVAGTSASCPVVAGVFARLNELRLAKGQPVLGFLNPFIYKNPSGFNDVTQGRNGGAVIFGNAGFPATQGWDAATGMGTPNYDALKDLI